MFYLKTFTDFEPIILAPSGIAAMNIGGSTIHRFFGIVSTSPGQGDEGAVVNLFGVDCNLHVLRAAGKPPFFILDEVSMLSASMFKILLTALGELANSTDVFGGYPLVAMGDFGQLGPIVKREEGAGWLHTEWLWTSNNIMFSFHIHHLTVSCRQGPEEQRFFRFLEIVRRGPLTESEQTFVEKIFHERFLHQDDMVDASVTGITVLSSRLDGVRIINNAMTNKLSAPDERVKYDAVDSVSIPMDVESWKAGLERETGLSTHLVLWVGARVIVTANLDVAGGVSNGAMGTICECQQDQVRVQLASSDVWIGRETRETSHGGVARSQLPLLLAYALTMHRAQGLTLNRVMVDLGDLFCPGQGYVAMSRVKRLEDLFIVRLPQNLNDLFPPKQVQPLLQRF